MLSSVTASLPSCGAAGFPSSFAKSFPTVITVGLQSWIDARENSLGVAIMQAFGKSVVAHRSYCWLALRRRRRLALRCHRKVALRRRPRHTLRHRSCLVLTLSHGLTLRCRCCLPSDEGTTRGDTWLQACGRVVANPGDEPRRRVEAKRGKAWGRAHGKAPRCGRGSSPGLTAFCPQLSSWLVPQICCYSSLGFAEARPQAS